MGKEKISKKKAELMAENAALKERVDAHYTSMLRYKELAEFRYWFNFWMGVGFLGVVWIFHAHMMN